MSQTKVLKSQDLVHETLTCTTHHKIAQNADHGTSIAELERGDKVFGAVDIDAGNRSTNEASHTHGSTTETSEFLLHQNNQGQRCSMLEECSSEQAVSELSHV